VYSNTGTDDLENLVFVENRIVHRIGLLTAKYAKGR
jgi:hypothetical protein